MSSQKAPDHRDDDEAAEFQLKIGGVAAVLFAEAMSSVRLFGLGEKVGFAWYLAWLLPGALDVYALTMLRFQARVRHGHPLRAKASREAILALVITVGCNALYEATNLFAAMLPAWAPGALFVLVSALAPFVAGRIIHFQSAVGAMRASVTVETTTATTTPARAVAAAQRRTATTTTIPTVADATAATTSTPTTAATTATAATTPTVAQATTTATTTPTRTTTTNTTSVATPTLKPPAVVARTDAGSDGSRVVDIADKRRTDADWAAIAAPHYLAHTRANNGKTPSAPELAVLLENAGHARLSNTRAREIRRATEKYIADNPTDEAERDGQAA